MEFNSKPATSIEQSKKLLAFGLKRETADCHYVNTSYTKKPKWELQFGVPNELFVKETPNRYIPAWSMHRLICLLFNSDCTLAELFEDDDIYEILIYSIESRVEEGYFNKEFLKNGNK